MLSLHKLSLLVVMIKIKRKLGGTYTKHSEIITHFYSMIYSIICVCVEIKKMKSNKSKQLQFLNLKKNQEVGINCSYEKENQVV